MQEPRVVVLYSTSVSTSSKLRTDIQHIRHILATLKVPYTEVDLASDPSRKEGMIAASGLKLLPQVHCDGQFIGDASAIQDLHDMGQLAEKLQGAAPKPE